MKLSTLFSLQLNEKATLPTKRPGTYAAYSFNSASRNSIKELQELLKARNSEFVPSGLDTIHSTLIYSRDPFDRYVPDEHHDNYEITDPQLAMLSNSKEKDYIVIKYKCPAQTAKFNYMRKLGAPWDFDEYIPHVTVGYVPKGSQMLLDDLDFKPSLKIAGEYVEDLNPDWDK